MSFLDDPLLLVPMHVDALAVGTSLPDSEMFQWTNLSPNFSKLQSDYFFGAKLVGDHTGDPFEQANGLETGTHLLFQLPRSFSRGRQGDADSLSFPPIPNRWLVQRFGGTPATHRAWLIKSDAAASDSVGASWAIFPQDEDTPVQLNRIGASTEVSAALGTEDEPASVRLTA